MASSSSSSCRALPVALGPLEGTNTSCFSSSSSSSPFPSCSSYCLSQTLPLRPRGRRPMRILYPPSQSRRPPPLREAPDRAQRWLLLLSVLLFLQIYTEEAQTCTELQSQNPDMTAPQHQEGEENLGTTPGWAAEEPWRVKPVGGASGTQLECVHVTSHFPRHHLLSDMDYRHEEE